MILLDFFVIGVLLLIVLLFIFLLRDSLRIILGLIIELKHKQEDNTK